MQDMSELYSQLAGKSGHVKPEEGVRVLVYGPRGQLKEIKVRKTSRTEGPGASICFWDPMHNRPRIQPDLTEMANDGLPSWGFYHELCRATGQVEYYEKAKRYYDKLAAAKASGAPRPLTPQVMGPPHEKDKNGPGSKYAYRPTPDSFYHPALLARRKGYSGSSELVQWKDFEVVVDESGDVPSVTIKGADDASIEDDFADVRNA